MPNSTTGLLPVAHGWSIAGLIVGPALAVTLIVANLAMAVAGQPVFLAGPLHTLAASLVIMLTICSLAVQLTARIIRGQRQIMARLDEIAEHDGDDRYAAGYADAMAARPDGATPVTRLGRSRR